MLEDGSFVKLKKSFCATYGHTYDKEYLVCEDADGDFFIVDEGIDKTYIEEEDVVEEDSCSCTSGKKKTDFKVGDVILYKGPLFDKMRAVVVGVPGECMYDNMDFSGADKGLCAVSEGEEHIFWFYKDHCEKVK